MELKIVLYNIHHGKDSAGRSSLAGLADFLARLQPHILCLNEVDVHNPRSSFIHQPKWLARQLGMGFVFGPTLGLCCLGYGNAILSSLPIRRLANRPLYSSREPRHALETEVLTPWGPLVVICTHLGLSVQERERQFRDLARITGSYVGRPMILAGDFNTSLPDLKLISRELQDTYVAHHGETGGTYPVPTGAKRIDYILCSRTITVLEQLHPRVLLSDHFPVMARVKLGL